MIIRERARARGPLPLLVNPTADPGCGTTTACHEPVWSPAAQIVAGQSSLKLFEPLSSGVWILVHGERSTFAQQYRP